jgi:hypothetical protein
MQFKFFIKNTLTKLRGGTPTPVILWQVILMLVTLMIFITMLYWYNIFYTIVYTQDATAGIVTEYKPVIKKADLKEVIEVYGL